MQIVRWTNWDDSKEEHTYLNDPMYEERLSTLIKELRERGYHFSGHYHQYGEYGVPIYDDGKALAVTQRTWGAIMADAFPEEIEKEIGRRDGWSYCVWAWGNPEYCPPSISMLPSG